MSELFRRLFLPAVVGFILSTTALEAGVVPTLKELSGADPKLAGEQCEVAGYRRDGDGGGGHFRFVAGDTRSVNGGTVLDAPHGRWIRTYEGALDVRWFGALPDGPNETNDVRAAFQAALDAGPDVVVPDGEFHVKVDSEIGARAWYLQSLRVHSGTRLTLSPSTRIVVVPPPGFDGQYCLLTTIGNGQPVTNVTINGRGGTLVGYRFAPNAKRTPLGHGLLFEGANLMVSNLALVTFGTCWKVNGSNVTMVNIQARDGGNNVGAITSGRGIQILDSTFSECHREDDNSPAAGIDVEPNRGERVEDLVIRGCRFEENDGQGLYLQSGHGYPPVRVTVEDCFFRGNLRSGLIVGACRDLTVNRVRSIGNQKFGFYFGGVTNAVVLDCTSTSNKVEGLRIVVSQGVRVEGGQFGTNGFYGIQVVRARGVVLAGVEAGGNLGENLHLSPTAEVVVTDRGKH